MSRKDKAQPIVAELGRPETPEETAARKAQNSRDHRSRQTVNNLILSLLATVGAVILIVLMVPSPKGPTHKSVDYTAVAAQAAGTEPDALVTPALSHAWRCNTAELHTDSPDGVDYWNIGLISPDDGYVGVSQGFDAGPSWTSAQLDQVPPGDHVTLDGVTWRKYDNHADSDPGNVKYGLATTAGHSTYVVYGTASLSAIEHVARSMTDQIRTAQADRVRQQ